MPDDMKDTQTREKSYIDQYSSKYKKSIQKRKEEREKILSGFIQHPKTDSEVNQNISRLRKLLIYFDKLLEDQNETDEFYDKIISERNELEIKDKYTEAKSVLYRLYENQKMLC